MSQVKIGAGPGNLTGGYSETRTMLAGSAITLGQVVAIDLSASGVAQGFTVVPAASGAVGTAFAVGVAKEAIASGAWGEVTVAGYAPVCKTDDGVAQGDYLVAHTVAGECDTMADGEEEQVFAFACSTDTSDETDVIVIKRI